MEWSSQSFSGFIRKRERTTDHGNKFQTQLQEPGAQRGREAAGLCHLKLYCWRPPGQGDSKDPPTPPWRCGYFPATPSSPTSYLREVLRLLTSSNIFIREFIICVKGNQDTPGIPWSLETHSFCGKRADIKGPYRDARTDESTVSGGYPGQRQDSSMWLQITQKLKKVERKLKKVERNVFQS